MTASLRINGFVERFVKKTSFGAQGDFENGVLANFLVKFIVKSKHGLYTLYMIQYLE